MQRILEGRSFAGRQLVRRIDETAFHQKKYEQGQDVNRDGRIEGGGCAIFEMVTRTKRVQVWSVVQVCSGCMAT